MKKIDFPLNNKKVAKELTFILRELIIGI